MAKKHKKGLVKMQANNAKAVNMPAEAIKPKMPKDPGTNSAGWLSSLTPSLGSGFKATWLRVVGSANQSPRQRLQLQLRLPKVPRPCEGPIGKAAANVRTDGLL